MKELMFAFRDETPAPGRFLLDFLPHSNHIGTIRHFSIDCLSNGEETSTVKADGFSLFCERTENDQLRLLITCCGEDTAEQLENLYSFLTSNMQMGSIVARGEWSVDENSLPAADLAQSGEMEKLLDERCDKIGKGSDEEYTRFCQVDF